jgi:anti-sigma factor RsiW
MTRIDERIERLIGRRLDGEISAEENAELDQALLRDPAARALLESYAMIDGLAAEVLRECAERRRPRLVVPPAARPDRAHARRGTWMLAGSALAACLALVIFLNTPDAPQQDDTKIANGASGITAPASAPSPVARSARTPGIGRPIDGGIWRVSDESAPRIDRTTDHNVLMVTDEKGNLYLLNVDLIREVERADGPAGIRFVNDPV